MVYVKWGIRIILLILLAAFFHYTLPQVDIARVTDTYEKRVDFGENSLFWAAPDVGTDETTVNRDVFFIQTVRTNDRVMVYRNEDTGWGWPPYFKFDTSNLQAEAADLKSTAENAKWAAVKHYGWRNEFLSIFPNAVEVWPVDGPDAAKPFPWLNILILVLFVALVVTIWLAWRRFRMDKIDPVVEDIEEGWDAASDAVAERRGKVRRWLDTWKAKGDR